MYNIIAIISQLNQPEYKVESIIAEYLKTLTFHRHHIEILFPKHLEKIILMCKLSAQPLFSNFYHIQYRKLFIRKKFLSVLGV